MNEVLTGGPEENEGERLYVNDEAIKVNAELTYAAQSECRKYPEYDLGTNVARGHMVYQDFMGTQDLARDLDDLRAAVGSEMLSVWGISYGTEVAATYASVYPERIDKLVLDGNVAVSNDVYGYGRLRPSVASRCGMASPLAATQTTSSGAATSATPSPPTTCARRCPTRRRRCTT